MQLERVDSELARLIVEEGRRQEDTIKLIASENYASQGVMAAMACPVEFGGAVWDNRLNDKYAEGYPGRRHYGGCEVVDEVEQLAIDRAKALFGAEHVNVQPHSGTQANLAVYAALLQIGDRVLGLDLAQGGHLSHGSRISLSGKLYTFAHYGVDPKTEMLDYGALGRQAREFRPKMIVAGASAYSRIIDWAALRAIADEVGALLMVDMAHIAGLVAGGAHPSPVPFADVVTTTTHKTLRGPRGGMILSRAEYGKAIDRGVFPGTQGGPFMHVIAAKAVCLKEASTPEFRSYAAQVVANARSLARGLEQR
ncbi:MAG: serine hydroxymethyltransferase, partial [Chloroflexota bacterium]